MAETVAKRSSCTRRKHGAVVVQNRRVRGTGYNGGPRGYGHCDGGSCPRARSDVPSGSSYETGPGRCIAIHAEANALLWTAPEERERATIYITGAPCFSCAKLIANSGIDEVVFTYGLPYETWDDTLSFLLECGVRVRAS
jgi:dCMP deaminase